MQEFKLNNFDRSVIKSLGGSLLTRGLGVDAIGSASGLITLWNEEFFSASACISNVRCIIVAEVLSRIGKEVVFCNVYAAYQENERRVIWELILQAQVSLKGSWCLGVILTPF